MHLHVHTHVHIKEAPFCLVALVKSQLRGGAVGLAALKVLKSRSGRGISAVRAEEHLWRTRFLLLQTAELCPLPACGPAAAHY